MAERSTVAREPLRVLQVLGNAINGGMESYVGNLIDNMPKWVVSTVIVPFSSRTTERWVSNGARVHVAPVDDEVELAASVERVVELARRVRADVIVSHLPNANAVSALAGAACGIPSVATLHGRALTLRDFEVMAASRAHALVVCESALAQALLLGIDRGRVHWIRSGIDTNRFTPRSEPAPRQGFNVGFVGRLSPEKAPQDFLRSAALIAARLPGARFVLFGDGPQRARIERDIARLKLAAHARLAGVVDDMASAYRELDLLISSSKSEGSPLAVLEAMASGLPVLATAVGGVPDIVCDGVTGRLFPPGAINDIAAAACDLALQREQRLAMGAAGRRRVLRRHSMRAHVESVVALLEQLAGRMTQPVRGEIHLARSTGTS